mmetsp:Transcript_39808/g.69955  ORF Transcript_39808/g.69955 Transcript_39808/m.69955 type:complete len:416 (-) Transcript_39808:65-1312(-)
MKFFASVCSFCLVGCAGLIDGLDSKDVSHQQARAISNVSQRSKIANADLSSHNSRFMHKPRSHGHHKRSPEQLEKELDDMARRVRSLSNQKLAKQLSSQLDEARASLCVQPGFRKHERVLCENFMRQACTHAFLQGKAGRRLPTPYCQLFYQHKKPESVQILEKAYERTVETIENILSSVGEAISGAFGGAKQEENVTSQSESVVVPGCRDEEWKSKSGRDCADYATDDLCTSRGTPGDGWLDEWGDFKEEENNGMTAADACCICGGGLRETGPAPAPAPASGPSPAFAAAAPSSGISIPAGLAPAPAPQEPHGPFFELGKGPRPLLEHGVSGRLVEHEDGRTMVSDWGREFGPKSEQTDFKIICAKHPGNEWCRLHGHYEQEQPQGRSDSRRMAGFSATFLVASLAGFWSAGLD